MTNVLKIILQIVSKRYVLTYVYILTTYVTGDPYVYSIKDNDGNKLILHSP